MPPAHAGNRTHFLSHGPSVSALGRGETAGARFTDTGSVFYNPALLGSVSEAVAGCAHFPLVEGSQYNFASVMTPVSDVCSFGFSVVNLRSGEIELRQNIGDTPQAASTMQTASLLTFATRPPFLHGLSFGLTLKYLDIDLAVHRGAATGLDAGFACDIAGPPLIQGSEFSLGASVANAVEPSLTLSRIEDRYPRAYRASAAFCMPTLYHLTGFDTITAYSDLLSCDGVTDIAAGLEYTFLHRTSLRGGYYSGHWTAGAGLRFGPAQIDYAADLSPFDQLHRFGLTWYWERSAGRSRDDSLMDEARRQMAESRKLDRARNKLAHPLFKAALKEYRKHRYLNATGQFRDIMLRYPEYDAARVYHARIVAEMTETAQLTDDTATLEEISYARAYQYYQAQKLTETLTEWEKTLQLNPNRIELIEYINALRDNLKDQKKREHESELDRQAAAMYADGQALSERKKLVASIKQMEVLIAFCSQEPFTGSFDWASRAREHIARMVKELSQSVAVPKKPEPHEQPKSPEADTIDTAGATARYSEGLVLYAQGKLADAARIWEIALRLDPGHLKARKALDKVREELSKQ